MHLIDFIITKIKGEEYKIDHSVPVFYILRLLMSKIISLIYGMCRLRILNRVYIHPSSIIKCPSKIKVGKNFSVARECYIDALSKNGFICGNNVSLGYCTHVEITGSLKHLGKGIKVGNNVGLGTHGFYGGAGGLLIDDDTIIGNYVSFHPENHNYDDLETPVRLQGVNHKGIKVGKNCWIGAKVTILDGVTIEDNCIIAAGAVLIAGTYKRNSIYGGVPAKFLKSRPTNISIS
jgi:acetyltransferase-like isoleucine patch superfamily enzyme